MAQAARQRVPVTDSHNWLRLDDAVKLTGESIRTWERKARSEAERARQKNRAPLAVKVHNGWQVNRALDQRLTRFPDRPGRDERAEPALYAKYSKHVVDAANRKAYWLLRWRERSAAVSATRAQVLAVEVASEAKQVEGADFPISGRALQRWHRQARGIGADGQVLGVEGLIDGRSASVPRGPNKEIRGRSPEAIDFFYGIYHSQGKHTVKTCHGATLREARKQGWNWPAGYAATTRWLRDHDQIDNTCLHREGPTVYSHKYLPHIERDWTAIHCGHTFVCDHTQCDFWCVFEGQQIRPWLTTIEDARSRSIVGWHLGDAPHQDAILAALRMAFREWAVPHRLYIDQGKDFTSELLTGVTKRERTAYRKQLGPDWRNALRHQGEVFWFGVLGELGIEVNYAIPYHAWSKGMMERWYGTFEDHCSKTFITYCGNSTTTRPECLEQIKRGYTDSEKRTLKRKYGSEWKRHAVLKLIDQSDIPTLGDSRTRVGEWIELYHRSAHRGAGMNGRTPLEVWATAGTLRKAGDDQLLALMQARGVYRVGGNGVAFQLAGQRHTYGASSSALRRFVGRDVFITLDPAHCECCHAYTADPQKRVYIGRLEANDRLPANTSIDELRRASKEVNRRRKAFNRANAEAPARIRNAAREVAAHRREQLAEARATGTDDIRATPNIVPVQTGFEGVSNMPRTPFESRPYTAAEPEETKLLSDDEARYAKVKIEDLDFSDQWEDDEDGTDASPDDEYATDGGTGLGELLDD